MRSLRSAVAALAAALIVVPTAGPAVAGPAPANGTVRVTVSAPSGVPANATLAGKARRIAAKPPAGGSAIVALTVPAGAYLLQGPAFTFAGVRYVAKPPLQAVVVRAGRTSTVAVAYAADGAARDLHASAISRSGVSLAWTAPRGARFLLRRTAGTTPVSLTSLGTGVPVTGATAVDKGLKAGATYTYSLFTELKGRWHGPLAAVVTTAAPAGSTQATYVAAPTTLLTRPADVTSATATGTGVRVVLAGHVATPLLGSAIVLPVSAALPGGFLGVVTASSADGRAVDLRSGALVDAFDYYELDAHDLAAVPGATAKVAPEAAPKAALKAGVECGGGAATSISFAPSFTRGGHFRTKVDKYRFLGADIPTGASLDVSFAVTVSGAASVETEAAVECGIGAGPFRWPISAAPVPLSIYFAPSASISVAGATKVSNVGLTATAGVQAAGSMTVKNGASFSGKRILDVTPLTPAVVKNGSIGVRVGGELIIGPGAGSTNAGVIAGISGDLTPLDASFKAFYAASDPRFNGCLKAEAKATLGLALTATAWLSNWNFSREIALDALTGSAQYGGSPWFFPSGCDKLPGEQPKDSLLGPGVTKVGETTVGGIDQWGHVDGFAPGKKTWVLSTGLIANALGEPTANASTDLGRPGDEQLTALAGNPTFDAAGYEVTIVPSGATLHVRYVFASEEYPEFVGSQFNDVMAVWVDGKNCATVPGSTDPVSVNTINHLTNSAYHVDNSTGAAGYATSMDALTVPLTCSVPVTPGTPVKVHIAVADSSDHVLDSAVALVDGGIWTD